MLTRHDPASLLAPGVLAAGIMALAVLAAAPAHAISSRTLFTPTATFSNDALGFSVSTAGDVNGDGFADVIVGAPLNDAGGANAGRAYIYFGGPAADATVDWTLSGAAANDQFGTSVGTAGDVNGDGYADVIVGAPLNDANGADAGRAYVYFGGPAPDATADLTLTGAAAGDRFGISVGTAGDVRGDGYADVIVGAQLNDAGAADAGRAYVYYGGPAMDATADLTLTGAATGDGFGFSVGTAGDVNGDHFDDVIVGAFGNDAGGAEAGRAYVYFGALAPDATADLTLTGAAAGDNFGWAVGTAGDVSGDGFADVIVGAPLNDNAGANAGRAYVFFGGPAADAIADLSPLGAAVGDEFGWSVGTAGDVNGDGYADVIGGALLNDFMGADAGRAQVYFGGPGADATADLLFLGAAAGDDFGHSVGTAGDVDGDGYADVVVGAILNDAGAANAGRAYVTAVYPYQLLSPNGGEQWVVGEPATVRWRGHDVADVALSSDGGATWNTLASGVGGAEDNEAAVIAPGPATTLARVRVVQTGVAAKHSTSDASEGVFRIVLPARAPAAAFRVGIAPTGAASEDYLGAAVGSAGDVNGDGFADVIVGAWGNDAAGADAGRAYVYFGGPAADAVADLTLTGAAAGNNFGSSVGTAGDVNGDGYADFIVGAPFFDAPAAEAGRAYVYFGGPGADAIADLTITGAVSGDFLGFAVGSAGDVNGDGYADIVVGAPGANGGAGRALVYFGGPAPDPVADLVLTGEASGDFFGYSAGTAGDVNGDGFADVIVGAPYNDNVAGGDAGRAYLYLGGPTPNAAADLTLTGAATGDNLGYAVGTAGDVNGDGRADLIVGAPLNDAGGTDAGRAYLYFGGPGADATPDLTLTGAAAGDDLGWTLGTAGDVNGDGYADLVVSAVGSDAGGTDAGRAYMFYGGPRADAVPDLTVTGASGDFLGAVAAAGNVDGKGYVDLIVGASGNNSNAGRAYVYSCNRYFVLSPNDDEVWNVGASASVSWLGAEPADLWLSTDGGSSYTLLRPNVGGSASNTLNLLVPHTPTRFARVKVTPADPAINGLDESDSTFTIQSSVALLSLLVSETDGGAELTWSSDPGVGPGGLAGYRLYRLIAGESGVGRRIGPDLIAETHYLDPDGARGTAYRLVAVNGLMEELELGRVALAPRIAGLRVSPSPASTRGELRVELPAPMAAPGFPATDLDVSVFDLAGRRIATLSHGSVAARDGVVSLRWDPRRAPGAGVFFLRATAPSAGYAAEARFVLIR